jgi:hypothetical protein
MKAVVTAMAISAISASREINRVLNSFNMMGFRGACARVQPGSREAEV